MKTKKQLLILVFLLVTLNINAQTNINSENIEGLFKEEIKSFDGFNFPVKSASGNIFLLDSVISIKIIDDNYRLLTNQDYKYDENGNLIEYSTKTTNQIYIQEWYKHVYQYDIFNNCIVEIDYRLDYSTLKLMQYRKIEREFDNKGNIISYIMYDDNPPFDGLDYYAKAEHIYNEKNDIIESRQYLWDENLNIWYLSLIWDWEYNENGNLIHKSLNKFDTIAQSWIVVSENYFDNNGHDSLFISTDTKFKYKVDTTANVFERVFFIQDTLGNWLNYNKTTLMFDTNGNKTLEINSEWNKIESKWVPDKKSEWSFNLENLQTQQMIYKWDVNLNDWIYSIKSESKYNSDNLLISSTILNWDDTISDLIFNFKKDYSYNSAGQMISETSYNWDSDSSIWIPELKISYEYDSYGNKKIENTYDWNFDSSDWQLKLNKEYFYSEFITNINPNLSEPQTIKIFPNPTNEFLTIEIQNQETVFGKLYNLNGKLLKNLTIQQGVNSFNLSDLKRGVYIIQIPKKEGMFVKKLVKN